MNIASSNQDAAGFFSELTDIKRHNKSCHESAELAKISLAKQPFALRYFNRVLVEFKFRWTTIYFGQNSWT